MWKRISLRMRVLLPAVALTVLTMAGGLMTLWFSQQLTVSFQEVDSEHLGVLKMIDQFELALVQQKGLATYFFQDGDHAWLDELTSHHQEFLAYLKAYEPKAKTIEEKNLLSRIESEYLHLDAQRKKMIALYQQGANDEGRKLERADRRDLLDLHGLIQRLKQLHEDRLFSTREKIRRRTVLMNVLAWTAMPLTILSSVLLVIILIRQVLGPIRRLAIDAARTGRLAGLDEVQALQRGVDILLKDVDQAKSELAASRAQLLQAAKMASVGRLAASVAHSIRNPLTAVKMRLFSLERSLAMFGTQSEDFGVISEEIRHIDNVLRNFLEYSRRPKLRVQRLSPSLVVDLAQDLMEPRLASQQIDLIIDRREPLPEIDLDPDQLKEALVNLLVNAAEAVGKNGRITITESLERGGSLGRTVVLRVKDNGPGVPAAVREQVFQLFFSTKDEGTGLGLSIATRIVEEHGGELVLANSPEAGATFIIRLPF